jgi:hydrogenase expression/formation protein HypE
MARGKSSKARSKSIEIEVQSKHYRPISSEWLANGVAMVNGKPVYWKAARQFAKWDVEPSAYDGWTLEVEDEGSVREMIVQALQENRKFLSQDQASGKEEKPTAKGPQISLAHGGGGALSHKLIQEVILKHLSNSEQEKPEDCATLPRQSGRLVFTTDTFAADPLFFGGGDIGKLAVCGTVNNISASAAKPVAVSLGLVLEEGLPVATLVDILVSIRKTADEAGVNVVTGDTRVVEKGRVNGMLINTTGLGTVFPRMRASLDRAKPGDAVLVSGTLGDHGIAVLCEREGLSFDSMPISDVAPIAPLVKSLIRSKVTIRCMKDPTRGGLATAANRIAAASKVQIELDEEELPVRPEVSDACDMLGLDPVSVPNQGRLVLVCSSATAKKALATMKKLPLGKGAAIIGEVSKGEAGRVVLRTGSGNSRILDMPHGDQLPRIL